MNEFEWRRQLRGLRQPLLPPRDLWLAIDASLDTTGASAPKVGHPKAARRTWLPGVGLAASLLLAGVIGWHLLPTPATGTSAGSTPWKPADPRLAGAAIELDSARLELQMALRQAPDSSALQRLLNRTERQQAQLRHLASQAG